MGTKTQGRGANRKIRQRIQPHGWIGTSTTDPPNLSKTKTTEERRLNERYECRRRVRRKNIKHVCPVHVLVARSIRSHAHRSNHSSERVQLSKILTSWTDSNRTSGCIATHGRTWALNARPQMTSDSSVLVGAVHSIRVDRSRIGKSSKMRYNESHSRQGSNLRPSADSTGLTFGQRNTSIGS